MEKYFAQTLQWATVIALLCQITATAEEIPPVLAESNSTFEATDEATGATAPHIKNAKQKAPLFRHTTYPAAWKAAQKTNRPLLVYVCMPNCPHCTKMKLQTFGLPQVKKLVSSSFETINASRYTHATLVQNLNIKWYPTTVLVGPNNKVLDVIEGYVDAQKLTLRLQTGLASLTPVVPETQTR